MSDYSTLRKQLLNELLHDKGVLQSVSSMQKKIKSGNATFSDVSKLAKSLAKTVSQKLGSNVPTEDIVGYAEEIVAPLYTKAQKTVLTAGKEVQKGYLKKANLKINPAEVKPDASRIKHIVGRYREAESIDSVSFLLGEDVAENILKAAVTDTIKVNARQLSNMGFKTYITRIDTGCCDWCASKVGTYTIEDLPEDFWQVHKNCSCSFEYHSKDTHDRISFATDESGKITKVTEGI